MEMIPTKFLQKAFKSSHHNASLPHTQHHEFKRPALLAS